MHLPNFESARKVGVPCPECGREFWTSKRNGRRRQFCTNACRQAHFRNAEFARRYQVPNPLRNAENTSTNSVACKAEKRGRAFPVDLLGHGFRWPGSGLDPEISKRIINVELGRRLKGVQR
jgi:endogenous inhibitor of DNA gyrase (YacG/DUF329 family)